MPRMHPRLVDWLLLVLVTFEALSGLITFLVGKPSGQWFFRLHGMVGLSLVVLVLWKMMRVSPRVSSGRVGSGLILSLAVFLLVVLAVGTGVTWVSFQVPLGYPNGINLHVIFGLLLLVLISLHTWMRHKPLPKTGLTSRRNFLSALSVGTLGFGAYWTQQKAGQQFELAGAERRFTGSQEAEGHLPVTMWMFDTVPSIDLTAWQLKVSGEVQTPLSFSWETWQQQPTVTEKVVLDCTGGWFKEESWEGVPVADLLDAAGLTESGRWVSFRSQSGYRWSLSLEEARKATLAWRMNQEFLSPGHGFPVRLVAPGHRGFQWVKWVTEVQVLPEADFGQWGAIFASGLRT